MHSALLQETWLNTCHYRWFIAEPLGLVYLDADQDDVYGLAAK
jgi:hypothetical protein